MRINSLRLTNFRQHAKTELTFGNGLTGIIGPNGAGKTSLMDAITGFTRAASGQVLINDRDITHDPPYKRARLGVSRSFQNLELYADMTVAEHVQTAADKHSPGGLARGYVRLGGGVPRAVAEILRDFELWEHRDQLPDQLSYGRRRLLGVARAMASGGAVLLIDEPVAGLNDSESDEFATVIRRLAHERGVAVLVIEHDMPFVMGLCDEVVVMDFGKHVAGGTPEQVVNDPAAITAYLGTDDEADSGHERDEPSLLLSTDDT